jgi:hypothetical protein
MVDWDGSHKPSRNPRRVSTSLLAKITRTFATNHSYSRFSHASRAKRGNGQAWRVLGLRRASGRPVEIRTDIGAPLAANLAGEQRLDIGQPDVIGPSVRADGRRVATAIVGTIDQETIKYFDIST